MPVKKLGAYIDQDGNYVSVAKKAKETKETKKTKETKAGVQSVFTGGKPCKWCEFTKSMYHMQGGQKKYKEVLKEASPAYAKYKSDVVEGGYKGSVIDWLIGYMRRLLGDAPKGLKYHGSY